MDIISIAPAPAPDSPVQTANTSGANSDSGFNSALNKAISATDNRNTSHDNTPSHSNNQQGHAISSTRNNDDTGSTDISVSRQDETIGREEGSKPEVQLPGLGTTNKEHIGFLFSSIMIKASLELPQGPQKAANTLSPEVTKSSETIGTPVFSSFTEEVLISSETLLKNTTLEKAFQSPYLSITVKGEATAQFTLGEGLSDKSSLLLTELQKLISNNNDKVQMTATFTTPSGKQELPGFMNSPLISQLASESAKLATQNQDKSLSAAAGVTTDQLSQVKTENQPPQLRQGTHGQFLDAKIISPEKSMEASVDNETLQQNSTSQQQTVLTTAANTASIPGQEHQGTHSFANSLHESFSNVPIDGARNPLPQPNSQSHLIREHEIINQIIQRFSVQTHLQSSRMSLQLHPAELGELKIDLLVKGDSLKGNIIAHTQQAQEIIEKNLPRLRTILQEQGISIEDLIVTFESDNVDDFSKQQEQLFQEQFATLSHQKKESSPLSFEQTIEETLFSEEHDVSGVNLTV